MTDSIKTTLTATGVLERVILSPEVDLILARLEVEKRFRLGSDNSEQLDLKTTRGHLKRKSGSSAAFCSPLICSSEDHYGTIIESAGSRASGEIPFELNSAKAAWLEQQRQFFSETLVEILTNALWEWTARNPGRSVNDLNATHVLRTALDEFILRHKDEFI